jgi:CubicO group peptidase (beta-lactamase class C family)
VRAWKQLVAAVALLAGAGGLLAQDLIPAPPQAKSAAATPATVPLQPSAKGVPLTKADVDTWLDGFVPYGIESGDIAGAVVVVVKDGQVLTERGFGYADVARRVPVSPQTTLFRTGSVSKLTTWTAVMQLVEQGKLNLDADVNTYLDFKIPPYDGKPITLRNIMTHTTGFQETVRRLISDNPSVMVPLQQYAKDSLPDRIYEPGKVPAYSNYGAALAGYIVQRVSGMSYDDYVDRNIFQPLGMTYATMRQPLPDKLKPFMSLGYGSASAKPEGYEYVVPAPAGSQAASGDAMAKFMIAHLNNGAGLLKPETAQMMHDYRLDILPPLHRMALGFYEDNVNGRRVIGHGGDTAFMHSNLDLFIDDNVGLFISMNSSGRPSAPRFLREALLKQFADRYFPAALPGQPIDQKVAREHARMMVGSYTNSRGFATNFMTLLDLVSQERIGVGQDGGILVPGAANSAGNPRHWIEIAPFVWRDRDSDMQLAAKVQNGKVVEWSFDTVSPFMMMLRVPWYRDSAWLLPAVIGALAIMLLSGLAWPAGAIARRRFKAAGRYEGRRLLYQRILHGGEWLTVLWFGGWGLWFTLAFGNLALLSGPLDPLLIALQVLSPFVLFGMLVLAGWNFWTAWTEKRGWFAKLWAVLLVLAAVIVLWVGLAFHLIGFGTNY